MLRASRANPGKSHVRILVIAVLSLLILMTASALLIRRDVDRMHHVDRHSDAIALARVRSDILGHAFDRMVLETAPGRTVVLTPWLADSFSAWQIAHRATSSGDLERDHGLDRSDVLGELFVDLDIIERQISAFLLPYLADGQNLGKGAVDIVAFHALVDDYNHAASSIIAGRSEEAVAAFTSVLRTVWGVFAGLAVGMGAIVALTYVRLTAVTRESHALASIGRAVSSAEELESVEGHFAELVRQLIPFDELVLVEHNWETNSTGKWHVATGELSSSPGHKFEYSESMASLFADSQTSGLFFGPRGLQEIAARVPEAAERIVQGYRSFVAGPLIWEGRRIGLLCMWSKAANAYGERDAQLATLVARQVVGSVVGARLRFEEAALAEMSRIIASTEVFDEVHEELFNVVGRLVRFDRVALVKYDYEAGLAINQYVANPGGKGAPAGAKSPLARSSILARFEANGRKGFVLTGAEVSEALWDLGFRSMVTAPLVHEDRVVGSLGLRSFTPGAYRARELRLVEKIAVQISGAIANTVLRKQRDELDSKREALEAANEARSQFLSMITHELKTPLTSVTAFADILARDRHQKLQKREADQVKIIQRNSRRLQEMIDDLLDLSRMESGRFELSLAPVAFGDLINEVVEIISSVLDAKKQRLVLGEIAEDALIEGDRSKLIQVLTNLVTNASKYSPEGARVEIDAKSDGK